MLPCIQTKWRKPRIYRCTCRVLPCTVWKECISLVKQNTKILQIYIFLYPFTTKYIQIQSLLKKKIDKEHSWIRARAILIFGPIIYLYVNRLTQLWHLAQLCSKAENLTSLYVTFVTTNEIHATVITSIYNLKVRSKKNRMFYYWALKLTILWYSAVERRTD
jgi:hypothetical protein